MQRRLTFPLPIRVGEPTPDGFTERRWTQADVLRSLSAGGWFSPHLPYSFDSPETARFAGQASAFFEDARREAARVMR